MTNGTFTQLIATCGHTYMGYSDHKQRPFCDGCNREYLRAAKADNERRARDRAARPARRHAVKFSRAKRLRIYERDGWTCQLCWLPVDQDLRNPDPGCASLDHIVCRSWTEKADHSDANLRLAHLLCNALRSDEGRYVESQRAMSSMT